MAGSSAASGTVVGTERSTRVVGPAIWTRQNPLPAPAPPPPPPPSATLPLLPGSVSTAVMSSPCSG